MTIYLLIKYKNYIIAAILMAFYVLVVSAARADSYDDFRGLENKHGGVLSVYAVNMNNDDVVFYKDEIRLPFCSTVKFMLVASLLKKSENEPSLLNKKILISKERVNKSGYAPVTKKFIDSYVSLKELAEAAITQSDNAAANIIIEEVGGISKVNEFAQTIGNAKFSLDRIAPQLNSAIPGDLRDTATTKFMTNAMAKIVFGNILQEYQRNLLKGWMINNKTGDNRIRAAAIQGSVIGDKTGGGAYGVTNDIGFILPKQCEKPIILSIFYRQSERNATPKDEVIKQATEIILQHFSQKGFCA